MLVDDRAHRLAPRFHPLTIANPADRSSPILAEPPLNQYVDQDVPGDDAYPTYLSSALIPQSQEPLKRIVDPADTHEEGK